MVIKEPETDPSSAPRGPRYVCQVRRYPPSGPVPPTGPTFLSLSRSANLCWWNVISLYTPFTREAPNGSLTIFY